MEVKVIRPGHDLTGGLTKEKKVDHGQKNRRKREETLDDGKRRHEWTWGTKKPKVAVQGKKFHRGGEGGTSKG